MIQRNAVLACCVLMLAVQPARAQEVAMDAGRLAHALDRLSSTARVLYVAAHPDDENTRLLAYLANARHVSATYLSMTRGGGGQNLIGREQDALLDVLRTQELLAARRLDGARQRFTRMRDFGYSKSAQETLSIWGHAEALGDVVRAIRSLQPDVVITRFDERPPNHGHHTASAILAREAFTAAADPKQFPEQLSQGVTVWQAKRLLHNWPVWKDEQPPSAAITLDVGSYDVRLGLSYGELAARSRSQHKSQGFGAAGERGPLLERFVHVAGTPAALDFLDGVELGWARFGASGQAFEAALKTARSQLHRDYPERSLPGLATAWRALAALPAADPRVRDARVELARLMAAASGLFVRANASRPACSPGSVVSARVEIVLRRPAELRLSRLTLPDGTSLQLPAAEQQGKSTAVTSEWPPKDALASIEVPGPMLAIEPGGAKPALSLNAQSVAPKSPPLTAAGQLAATTRPAPAAHDPASLAQHEKREISVELKCPASAPISTPYWLAEPPLPGHHVLADPSLADDPEGQPPLMAALDVNLAGVDLPLPVPFVYTWLDRVHGERERRVLVEPPATVTPARDAVMFPNGHSTKVSVRVRSARDGLDARAFLRLPPGYRAEPAEQRVQLARAGDDATIDFTVTPPANGGGAAGVRLWAEPVISVDGREYSFREDVIDYPHVPLQVVLQPAKIRLSPVALQKPRGLIGYVEGSGDTIAADLTHVGAQVELLSDAALLEGDLSRFSAIVIGVRAYNTRDVLPRVHARLKKYVEQGGTLVVQYVTRSTISPLDAPVGPYSLDIGRGRVTDENATLHALDPRAPVLRTPHKIGPDDFAGWVQERGLYFADRWDERYKPVFEIADPGEPAQRGALLIANVGRGRYVYTGLAFFRQLPAGVPGAYRLFLNLLARANEAP
jgi:LmbE family N-acetylglucosaminyl deacetylase